MPRLSVVLQNEILDAILSNAAITTTPVVYLSLHSADPGITGASELTAADYARVPVTWGAAVDGVKSNTPATDFAAATSVWGTATYAGLWRDATGGTWIIGGALTSPITVNVDDLVSFSAGALVVTDNT